MDEEEFKARMDIITWTFNNLNKMDLRDQMIVISAMLDMADLFEMIYKKYNGKVFFMNLGDDNDN